MPVITLLTDFGLKDGNVGVMKGVILELCPSCEIVDLSHQISPQNIAEAGLILFRSAPYFPSNTVHLIVVDPGVGTSRRPIAARLGDHFFVAPDNGLLSQIYHRAIEDGEPVHFYHLDNPRFWRPEVSHVFHGRDIFAPCAAHLARGVSIHSLGSEITDPLILPSDLPAKTNFGLVGKVIHVDNFGNISTNISQEHLADHQKLEIITPTARIEGLLKTFGERPASSLIALLGSTGSLIISEVNGSAADRLKLKIGDRIEVNWIA